MTYKNFPVFVGYANKDFGKTAFFWTKDEQMLYADSVSINYSSSSKPNRRLGVEVDQDQQYVYDADISCGITMGFYLYAYPRNDGGGEGAYAFLMDGGELSDNIRGNGTGKNYFPIRIGENTYNKCYVDSYTINVDAFQPVKCSVQFKCYDPPKEGPTRFSDVVPFDEYNEYMSGLGIITANTCELSGLYDDVVYGDVVPKVSYSKRYARTPVYTLGSIKPTSFLMDAVESQSRIESTGLSNFANYSGAQLTGAIALNIKDGDGNRILPQYDGGFDFVINSGAKVNSYNYSIQGGDVIKSDVTIDEVIL